MKRSILKIAFIINLLTLFSGYSYSANERFRSVTSGNWNSNSTWEMSLNNGVSWIPATSTPRDTSGLINVRSPNTVTVTVSVIADQLTVESGATLTLNTGIIFTILNGSGNDFTLQSGGVTTGAGLFQTQGLSVVMILTNGSNFNTDFKVNTGSATATDNLSPLTARFFGTITVDAGATLSTGNGSFSLNAYDTVTNNGTISGISGAALVVKGPVFTNAGSVISSGLIFDSTTNLSGAGTFSSSAILIDSAATVNLTGNITFSPGSSFTINSGGTLNPNSQIFTLSSGQMIANNGSTITNSGTFRTQGIVSFNLKAGSAFNAPLNVISGTTTAQNTTSPLITKLFGSITVDNSATLNTGNGAYVLEAYGPVTNNGTISGSSGATFELRSSSLINNGSMTSTKLEFDSASSLSGSGSFTNANILVDSSGNVSMSNDITFSPGTNFTINSGGILNPNSNTFTFKSGQFILNDEATVMNSGTFRTQGSITLNIKQNSFFNAPLKINTGITTAINTTSPLLSRVFGEVSIDNGATLNTGNGSYEFEANNTVTNNGMIDGTSGSAFTLLGSTLINNGVIDSPVLNLDTTSVISGAGSFTSANINIGISDIITLGNNITFTPGSNFTIALSGSLNLNSNNLILASGTFVLNNSAVVSGPGTFNTQGNVSLNIKNGSGFNAALIINSGTTIVTDPAAPLTAKLNGTITINSGAVMNIGNGNYKLEAYGNVTNNGILTGGTNAEFRMFGAGLINNGLIIPPSFIFQTGAHTLQGTGSWATSATMLNGANVSLTSNHQLFAVNINAGGTFNISNFTAKFNSSNPITQNGTFTAANSNVEYNGTASQVISTTNITYDGLRINNPANTLILNNVTVNDTLAVILGDLNLNGRVITISPTGYLTETPGNTVKGVTGHIVTTRNIGTPSSLNVGGFGAVLTANANLGSTEIKRGHTVQFGLNGGTSIQRYYDITPANNSGLNASLVFKFDDSELNGKPEPSLKLFKSTNAGATWLFQGWNVNIAANEITLTGLTSFSRWSADSSGVSAAIGLIMEGFYNIATNDLNMVDTVRAYLRNTSSPYAVIDSSKGFVDSLTFKSALQFLNAPSGTYYIQLKHRNSLETWSKNGVNYIQDSTLNYDFTFAAAQAFGNNMTLKGTKYCLYSGDVTQNGFIDLDDVLLINNDSRNFVNGYVSTDVNGNSVVDLTDVLIAYNNSNNFVSVKRCNYNTLQITN
ncbi:MAG: hypothetical protein IPL53_03755 [Ignavibacteria bacterium]|nr:hypothetical protein [Ignavibacteria bacterium]